jgi:signal transduction histidine kinase
MADGSFPGFDAHTLWQQTSAAILTLSEQGILLTTNPSGAALFGLPESALTGKALVDFLDPFSRDKALAMLAEAAYTGSALNWELDILTPDGTPKLISFAVDRLETELPALGRYVLVCSDLSTQLDLSARLSTLNQQLEGALLDLEKAHYSLQETQAQLVQSEKMRSLGQLVTGIAHEINNPLGFVKNNVTYLIQSLPKLEKIAQQARVASLAKQDADSLDNLLVDMREISSENLDGLLRIENIVLALRNFSRLDEADYQLADLEEGVNSSLKLIRPTCGSRIRLDVDLEPLPLTFCHPGELNQVLMNLLINAIQAIPGEGSIALRARAADGLIRISIQDSGNGMSPDVLSHLGEPFFTTKPVGSGTGLGLAISMGIVNRHHGKLLFASQPGAGTLVTIELPVRLSQERQ